MSENEKFSNGLRNVHDAKFIRDSIVPVAIEHEKWNLVVHESHRSVELLLGGLIYLLGGDPMQSKHNLEGLVQKFQGCINDSKGGITFDVSYYSGSNEYYGIRVLDGAIKVYRKGTDDKYYQIIQAKFDEGSPEKGSKIELAMRENGIITVYANGENAAEWEELERTQTELIGVRHHFNIKPRSERLRELKNIGKCFTHELLLHSRYSKREFEEEEAMNVRSSMMEAFVVSENIVSIEV